jgi:hypothetical protein
MTASDFKKTIHQFLNGNFYSKLVSQILTIAHSELVKLLDETPGLLIGCKKYGFVIESISRDFKTIKIRSRAWFMYNDQSFENYNELIPLEKAKEDRSAFAKKNEELCGIECDRFDILFKLAEEFQRRKFKVFFDNDNQSMVVAIDLDN